MASGKHHALASLLVALPAGYLTHRIVGDATYGVLGAVMGTVLSPDLDLIEIPKRTVPEQIMHSIPIVGVLFVIYWHVYGISIPHRHPLSHLPGLGTLFRMAYAITLPTVVVSAFLVLGWLHISQVVSVLAQLWPDAVLGIFMGLFLSDLLHWVMDGLPVGSYRID